MERIRAQCGRYALAESLPLKDARSGFKKETNLSYVDLGNMKRHQ